MEALLPMLHLKNAGFEFEITAPTGKPVAFEMWAFPKENENVTTSIMNLKQIQNPKSLADFVVLFSTNRINMQFLCLVGMGL